MHNNNNNINANYIQINRSFNENTALTRNTFPRVNDLREIFHTDDFNTVLNTVKNRIITDRRANHLQNGSRINHNELQNIPQNTINEVKDFLRELGYRVVDIEDQNNVVTAWKVYI